MGSAPVAAVHIEAKLAEMGIELPVPPEPKGNYILTVRAGQMIHTAGHLPLPPGGELMVGKVGVDYTVEVRAGTRGADRQLRRREEGREEGAHPRTPNH